MRSSPEVKLPALTTRPQAQGSSGLVVEYVGPTSLRVRGPVSGQTYRFASNGMRIVIDGRDAPFLLAIPHLRKRTQNP
jgi:hypothetical protein